MDAAQREWLRSEIDREKRRRLAGGAPRPVAIETAPRKNLESTFEVHMPDRGGTATYIPRPQRWARREIIRHIDEWVRRHGRPPTSLEWNAPRGRGFPSTASLVRKFGSFDNAIRAARYEPRGPGGCTRQTGTTRVRKQKRTARLQTRHLQAAYVLYKRGKSVPELADLLWERFGYPSPTACRHAILKGFHLEGFQLRTKSEARLALPPERRSAIAAKARAARQCSLTPEVTDEILARRGLERQIDTARALGVSQATVSRIRLREAVVSA